jgi:L(+)-tartrate dehydratase beta subunit
MQRLTMAHYDFQMPITEPQARALKAGDTVTLNGTLYGIRDATLIHMFDKGRTTRFDMRGHAVIHTAPNVRWVGESEEHPSGYEKVCIGTTTSARMERFTGPLMQQYGVRMVIGKGGLAQGSLDAFRDLGGVYVAIIGGAAALETTWIESIEEVDLDDLNPESLWKFRVKDFGPLLVSMDSHGNSLYTQVNASARDKRAAALAAQGVKA